MIPAARISCLLLLLFLLLLVSACQREEPAAASPVLLQVNGRSVSLEQFRREFEATLPSGQELSEEQRRGLQRSFLVQVIDRELALAEADRRGTTVSSSAVEAALQEYRRDYPAGSFERMLEERGIDLEEWRQGLHQNLLMEKVVREAAYATVAVAEEEIAAYYGEHPEEFDRPEQVRARQIVVPTEEEGQKILGLLRQGDSFEETARRFSLSPDSEEGGDLGFFARGEMPPEFDEAVFNLSPGQLSDLVKSEYGYHVFLVEERREAVQLGLDEVREEIRARLRAAKEERAYQDWLREMRGRAVLEIDSSLL